MQSRPTLSALPKMPTSCGTGNIKICQAFFLTLERGWCFGSEEFREKMSLLVGDSKLDSGSSTSKANGYTGKQINDHAEATARLWIERGLEVLGLSKTDLETINKTDWRKAMIVRSIRKHSSVKLEWIARELHMGVRSGVTRAEQMLKTLLENQETIQKTSRKTARLHLQGPPPLPRLPPAPCP